MCSRHVEKKKQKIKYSIYKKQPVTDRIRAVTLKNSYFKNYNDWLSTNDNRVFKFLFQFECGTSSFSCYATRMRRFSIDSDNTLLLWDIKLYRIFIEFY